MAFQAIRQGLILTIPVLLVGSFCLIFLNLPLEPYQDALAGAPHIEGLLNFVYNATMGIFSLYVAVAVALRYANACAERHGAFFIQGAPFAALAAYLMSVGFGAEGFDLVVLQHALAVHRHRVRVGVIRAVLQARAAAPCSRVVRRHP